MANDDSDIKQIPEASEYLVDAIVVKLAEVFVDHTYQRSAKTGKIKQLVEGWSWKRYFPIIVTHRAARYSIIDGQQRFLAAQELGIEALPAILVVARSLEDEAELFIGANDTANVGAGERFRARVVIKDADALEIMRIVTEAGFTLDCMAPTGHTTDALYGIGAIHAIEQLYNYGTLADVLDTVHRSWGGQPTRDMTTGPVLHGVHLALKHLARFDVARDKLIERLQPLSVKKLLDKGYERYKSMVTSRSVPGGIAAVIVETYNYRRPATRSVPGYDRSAARVLQATTGGRAASASNAREDGRYVRRVK